MRGDVKMFLFYFENVAIRGKKDSEKHPELLFHLYGEAFECY